MPISKTICAAAALLLAASSLEALTMASVSAAAGYSAPDGSIPPCMDTQQASGFFEADAASTGCGAYATSTVIGNAEMDLDINGVVTLIGFGEHGEGSDHSTAAVQGNAQVKVTASQDQTFVVRGPADGNGYLVFNYTRYNAGQLGPGYTVTGSFSVALGGVPIADFQCFPCAYDASIEIPVTFGSVFDLEQTLQFTVGGGGSGGAFSEDFFVNMGSYSILDGNHQPINNEELVASPEPATWWTIAGGLVMFAVLHRRRILIQRNS